MSRRPSPSRPTYGDNRSYSLDELTSLADVTVRTVRYYIAEGLLLPPVCAGRNASYTQGHLDRLRLIARFKEEYLPLKEIRRRLQTMTPEEIRDAVNMVSDTAIATPAAQYIAGAMQESHAVRHLSRRPASAPVSSSLPELEEQAWRRFHISDEAELLITESAQKRRSEQLNTAIDWLRRILNES